MTPPQPAQDQEPGSGPIRVARTVAAAIADPLPADHRFVVAIAGPPAAGKSTLAEAVQQELGDRAAIVGMDAFHFDNAVLEARGDRERKGAPHTFDVEAYRRTVAMLRAEPDLEISVPVFDRALEAARNCAAIITPAHQILITEGNYLLLDDPPWSGLRELWDLSVWVDVPIETVSARILARWDAHGLSPADAQRRAEGNDLPNARLVMAQSATADLTVPGV